MLELGSDGVVVLVLSLASLVLCCSKVMMSITHKMRKAMHAMASIDRCRVYLVISTAFIVVRDLNPSCATYTPPILHSCSVKHVELDQR